MVEDYKLYYDKYMADRKTQMLRAAKRRASVKEIEFDIEISDIDIPEFCPILGLKLDFFNGKEDKDTSPSLDRKDNSKGYIKSNVRIISHRANRLKSNATIEDLEALLKDLKSQ